MPVAVKKSSEIVDNVPLGSQDRTQGIYIILGQRYLREHEGLFACITALEKSHPDWTADQIVNYANQQIVHGQMKNSMLAAPGVVVMTPGLSGRLTTGMDGTPGTMSRHSASNAVVATGNQPGVRPQ